MPELRRICRRGYRKSDKKQDNNKNLAKSFWSEYDGKETDFSLAALLDITNKKYLNSTSSLYDICLSSPGQPPELISG